MGIGMGRNGHPLIRGMGCKRRCRRALEVSGGCPAPGGGGPAPGQQGSVSQGAKVRRRSGAGQVEVMHREKAWGAPGAKGTASAFFLS